MNGYLETGLSLVFIFFIFSIIAYILQEMLAINLQYRGRLLWRSLSQLLDGISVEGRGLGRKETISPLQKNTAALFNHPQVKTLRKQLDRLPSYIPSGNFALAVMDLVAKQLPADKRTSNLFKDIQLALQQLPADKEAIYVVLENLVATSVDARDLQQKIEDWFNDYMTRVTGWYKSNTVITLRIIAVGLTLFFNINVISLSKEIFRNAQLRSSLSNAAMNVAANRQRMQTYLNNNRSAYLDSVDAAYQQQLLNARTRQDSLQVQEQRSVAMAAALENYNRQALASADTVYQQIAATQLPMGWSADAWKKLLLGEQGTSDVVETIVRIFWALLGWAIAAGCISMGAPFWFDVMLKLVNVRRAGLVPDGNAKK